MILCNGLKCYFLEDFLLAFTKFAMGPNSLVPNDFHKITKLPVMFNCISTGKITALLTHPFPPLLTWNPSVISCLPSHHSPYWMLSPAGQALLTHLLVKVKWCLNITWVGSRKVQPTSTLCTYPGSTLVSQVPVARHTQTQQYSPYSQTDSDYRKSEIILLNPTVNLAAQIQWKVNQER